MQESSCVLALNYYDWTPAGCRRCVPASDQATLPSPPSVATDVASPSPPIKSVTALGAQALRTLQGLSAAAIGQTIRYSTRYGAQRFAVVWFGRPLALHAASRRLSTWQRPTKSKTTGVAQESDSLPTDVGSYGDPVDE